MKWNYLLVLFLMIYSERVFPQQFSSEENRKEAQNLLNTVINSKPFDSVYDRKQVVFLANDLLTEDSPLFLKRFNYKAKILSKEKIMVNQYVVLCDVTLDWDNLTAARVQIEILPQKTLLNLRLIKSEDVWVISNYAIFQDYEDYLMVLKIRNNLLLNIIDSVVDFEKRCDHYSKDLLFFIRLNVIDSTVQIESYKHAVKSADLGCLMYQGHLFIVSGKSLDTNLFIKTEEKRKIDYFRSKTEDDSKIGKVTDVVGNDSFTIWWYKYIDGKFILIDHHTICEQ